MIIYDGPGDLFRCGTQTIACPINVVGTMGAGLAKTFRDRVPGLLKFYRRCYAPHTAPLHERVRRLAVFSDGGNRQVLLFPTKGDWRDPSELSVVADNLRTLSEQTTLLGIRTLGLPRLGCGLGGLDWNRGVRPLIYQYFQAHPIDVKLLV